jgi:23S rRNA pseudoU1915 N3-methylase RlmH
MAKKWEKLSESTKNQYSNALRRAWESGKPIDELVNMDLSEFGKAMNSKGSEPYLKRLQGMIQQARLSQARLENTARKSAKKLGVPRDLEKEAMSEIIRETNQIYIPNKKGRQKNFEDFANALMDKLGLSREEALEVADQHSAGEQGLPQSVMRARIKAKRLAEDSGISLEEAQKIVEKEENMPPAIWDLHIDEEIQELYYEKYL